MVDMANLDIQVNWWISPSLVHAAVLPGSGVRGHKTTRNFLSHIKWHKIIHWTRFL